MVAHGTVISLYLAEKCGIDGFEIWAGWGSPSYMVLTLPRFELVKVVDEV